MKWDEVRFEEIFDAAMKRAIPPFHVLKEGISINLGSGMIPIEGCDNLDRPKWNAPWLSYHTNSVSTVFAFHFLEHLDRPDLVQMMKEIIRVLKPGGSFIYCVPYALAPIAFMDVDHKTFWAEDTMRTLITSRGYDSAIEGAEGMRQMNQWIVGVDSRNLAVIGQLQKMGI